MSIIAVNGVYKTLGEGAAETPVLKGISLAVEPGEFIAITGPSGSGKTTLMNIIGLLDEPSAGTYALEDAPVNYTHDSHLAELRLMHMGFIFQNFNLIGGLSALENVELPMIYAHSRKSARRPRAEALLQMVGLGDKLKNKPNELSGGQMQRVAIARALANNPRLLLADEPTGNLDTQTGQAIMQTLQYLHAQGVTIIMVTHDLNLALQTNRIITVQDGIIVGQQAGGLR